MTTDTGTPSKALPMGDPFRHPALFYSGERDYLDGTLSFVRAGLAAGEPVAVAVPGPNLQLLRAALGQDAAAVHMVDMWRAGRNPGRIIPGVLAAFADAFPGTRHVRLIGEPIWPGRSSREYPACVKHEALINLAFAGRRVTILCPYDVNRLDPAVVTDAKFTHPVLRRSGRDEPSHVFAPNDILTTYNRPFSAPNPDSGALTVLEFALADLARVRQAAAEQAAGHGMSRDRTDAVEMVVNELAVNSVRHGGGAGTLRLWTEDGLFICEITDKGHLSDPLAGRRNVGLSIHGERGLLLAHAWSDLLRLHTTPAGTTIRAHFALAPVPRREPLPTR
jgi:anti-sigma regulatory factor (Ser/Thr protein kinase)